MLSLVTALVYTAMDVICIKRANDKAATNMEKIHVASKGRTFVNGCALSKDLRKLIVHEVVRNGGILTLATFQANFHMWQTLLK